MGQLQSFAGCPISCCCDMTSKRASKSKSGIRGEMAKASGSEVHPSYSKVYMKAREGETCRLRSCPSRPEMQLLLLSPQADAHLYLLKPASRGIFPPMLKPDGLARNVSLGWRLSWPLPMGIHSDGPNTKGVLTVKSPLRSDGNRRHPGKDEAKLVLTRTQ
jgi:hypothetical protein